MAEQACHIEMKLAGHPVGKHDHYIAAFGGITCLDIQPDGRVHVAPLDISITTVEELRVCPLLFYTGMTRRSSEILEAQKQDTLRGESAVVESLHRTKEIGYRIKEALEHGIWSVLVCCSMSIGRTRNVARARSAIRILTVGTRSPKRVGRWVGRLWGLVVAVS